MLEMDRGTRGLRPQFLLQPLAHGIADGSARLAINLLALVGGVAVHDGFRMICS